MLGEPLPHPLIGPGPLKRMRVEPVVLRPGGQHMRDELLSTAPRGPLQVVVLERPDQQLRLVQPRGVRRREAGPPPTPAARPVRRRLARRVRGVPVPDQENYPQPPIPAAEAPQPPDMVPGVLLSLHG